jgi:ABC-type xylose transport system substrate-binding protein
MIKNKNWMLFSDTINAKTDVFLIVNNDSDIKIYALKAEQQKCISINAYSNLIKNFKRKQIFYTFNMEAASVYYHFDKPNEHCILWFYYNPNK